MRSSWMVLAILCLAVPGRAAIVEFGTVLKGANEVPPRVTPASGQVSAVLNTNTRELTLTGWYADLLAPSTGAHIHGPATPAVNAPVMVPLTHAFAHSGGLGISGGSTIVTPVIMQAMLEGKTYVNVHSSQFPGGEIRGQLYSVPEPGSLALLGAGAVLIVRRRKRAA